MHVIATVIIDKNNETINNNNMDIKKKHFDFSLVYNL